ncbi:MAG: MBL fold metallo-hydrolase, partial [Oscillospiraceae bacterium]|nr:MBL fold metallo-hydrolase [Oscillospiraceae bacterium]
MDDLLIQTVAAPLLDANMHLVRTGRHAFAVDPFPAPELLETLEQNQVTVDFVFLTHEHYDHISGAAWFKARTGCQICCSRLCAENITRPEKNLLKYFDQLVAVLPADKRHLATGP